MISRLSTWWNELTTDPLNFLISAVIFAAALLFSLIMHENAHGFVAWKCGDPTAKMFGRITMDPRKHLDPVGALCMLFLGIGWARPVPVSEQFPETGSGHGPGFCGGDRYEPDYIYYQYISVCADVYRSFFCGKRIYL